MLDIGLHQASGLHSFTPQAELRVVAVASQSHGGNGLETVWQMCASLQRLGLPVVVLDGTAQETEDSPGLLHVLEQAPWGEGTGPHASAHASAASVAVIPAARGLQHLRHQAHATHCAPLTRLLAYFRAYGMVVLHAPSATLGPLLTHTTTTPLIVMEGGSAGVLASYRSIKQIALDTGLHCMVAALLRNDTMPQRRKTTAALQTLQGCALRHLGSTVRTTVVATNSHQDIQRLALQLLENAGTIGASHGALPSSHVTDLPGHFVRSH